MDRIDEKAAEEIIRKKERDNAKNFNQDESTDKTEEKSVVPVSTDVHEAAEARIDRSRGGLGVLKSGNPESEIHGANDEYWKNVPIQNLPSAGLFYPDNAELTIRSAEVGEIRHWSTIDENDFLDMDAKMNFIIEKCVRFRGANKEPLSWKDLLEIDRFYIIFLVHEITFPNGENKLFVKFGCNMQCKGDGTYREKVHLKANMLNLLIIPEDIMKYYSPEHKCFAKVSEKLKEELRFYLPTVGVSQKIKGLIKDARDNSNYVDPAFIKIAPFLIKEWRDINEGYLEKLRIQTFNWNKNKTLFVTGFADKLEQSVNLTVKRECKQCGVVLEVPLFFRDGFTIKNLFVVSASLDDLI